MFEEQMMKTRMKKYNTIPFICTKYCMLIVFIFISCPFGSMQNISTCSQFNSSWEQQENGGNYLHIQQRLSEILLNLF